MRPGRIISLVNMQSWSDQALNLVNSTANVIAIVAAALVLIALALIYFTGTEMTGRAKQKSLAAGQDHTTSWRTSKLETELAAARRAEESKAAHVSRLTTELVTARRSEESKGARVSQLEREVTAARRSEKTKAARVSQLETELASARLSEETKSARLSQAAAELAATQRSEEAKTSRLAQVEADLAAAHDSETAKASRLAQLETELTAARGAEGAKTSRVTQLEAELAAARRADETKALRLSQLEAELATARRGDETKAFRLAQVEADLETARREAQEAKTQAREAKVLVEKNDEKQHPRRLTPEQRTEFLNAVRGMPTGKVIVSAFFNNTETHEIGTEILGLLNEAGFNVIEPAPLDFFTTSRPTSGIRIGFQSTHGAPSHVSTLRKGFTAIGLDPLTTSVVNAHERDVVEIQVTPKE